uniref:J domain-containing protein n=1 Tax=Zea mays TaxID=4577 RepID=A0A804MCY1_MAIZE
MQAAAAAAPWTTKTLPVFGNHLGNPTRFTGASSSFHSTPASFAKWRNKWDCHKISCCQNIVQSEKGARKASRNYERYVVRQKRAEGKKALKDYLLYGKSLPHLQDGSTGSFANSHAIPRFKTFRKGPQTHWSSNSWQGVHNHRKNKKDKERFCNFFHDDHHVHPDDIFEAVFGAHYGFTWSQISWEGFHFRDKSFRFRWSGRESRREKIPCDSEDEESADESRETASVGSHAHRVILGLQPCGPLTLEDVKTATHLNYLRPVDVACSFRASALRWHPDRHPGSSQAMAEEKFKLCVNAYNSLCSVLKAA